ncbi:Bug family tripartite tricarboxylate transporter substrate binding protein [Roseateles chitinivorans]|uniref:Bug family tripartite tricarboxylate transporter substrate binding protein n=1 Tax=Roseateles chitinivorans TaxID=2917965 RepID=UPI003D668711
MLTKRQFCAFTALGAVLPAARAQAYPGKPVTIVVPQAPGGTNDAVGRILAQKLTEKYGQVFNIDNRAGAGGNIGTELASRAPKDGYTLLLTISSTQAINPALYRRTGFDPVKDFDPIAPIGVVPNVLVVHPSFPAKDLKGFIAAAKAKNPSYQYASAGNGSLNHLLGEMLNRSAGLQLEHVPYKGVGPALTDMLGGQVSVGFASLPSCLEYVRAGKLVALGVSSPKRSSALPDVPAIGELVPGFSGELWVGLFALHGTPDAITKQLAEAVTSVMNTPDALARLKALGVEPLGGGPTALAAMLKQDIARWEPIVKGSGARVD